MHTRIPADFALILRGMPQPYLVLSASLVIVGASDSYLALTRRTLEDIVGRHILEAFPGNPDAAGTVEQGPLEVSLRHVLATGLPHEMPAIQYDIPQPGGGFAQKFWTPVHTPVAGPDGRIEYIIQNPMDVTETIVKSREADARLRVALHAADLAAWEYEPETDIWRRSHTVDEMFGFGPGEGGPVAAPFFARMHPEDLARVSDVIKSVLDSPDQTAMNFDYRIMLPSGNVRYVLSQGEVLRTSTGKVRMLGALMDVTTDRLREAELASAVYSQRDLLKQKDDLLAEVNHRVKNSLQLVVSTLRLQARRLEDPATASAFEQAISRVRAIVSVHERLYRTSNSMTVDMADHLTSLCLDLAGRPDTARIRVEAQTLQMPTERAIPISVIVNELLAPPLRPSANHAEEIVVSLSELVGHRIELAVSATNTHAPGAFMPSDLSSKLVTSMAAQIGGTISWDTFDDGYRASVTFPKEFA